MTAFIALLRGINVGKAKRIAMADLRALVEGLGFHNVKTLLNSGNVVFSAPSGGAVGTTRAAASAATRIETAIATQFGVKARVTVVTGDELGAIVAQNPLLIAATDPSRLLVAVLADANCRAKLDPLARQDWGEEALALGPPRAAYIWCPAGVLDSKPAAAINRALGDAVTMRNWATIQKLRALAEGTE